MSTKIPTKPGQLTDSQLVKAKGLAWVIVRLKANMVLCFEGFVFPLFLFMFIGSSTTGFFNTITWVFMFCFGWFFYILAKIEQRKKYLESKKELM